MRWCLQLTVKNLFSSFPQDAEISAFELRNILNKIMAKRKYLPQTAASVDHQQVSSMAVRAESTPLTWAESKPWALPQTCGLALRVATATCYLCSFRGLHCTEAVFHRMRALAGCIWVPFIPASATGNWLPGR